MNKELIIMMIITLICLLALTVIEEAIGDKCLTCGYSMPIGLSKCLDIHKDPWCCGMSDTPKYCWKDGVCRDYDNLTEEEIYCSEELKLGEER